MNFTTKQIQQIEDKGLTVHHVLKQIELFKNGMPFINLESAAVIGQGILKRSDAEDKTYLNFYNTKKEQLTVVKFVPASGAATRMFKFLFQFLETYDSNKETVNAYINKQNATELSLFMVGLEKFPFYNTLLEAAKKDNPNYSELSNSKKVVVLVQTLLDENHLNYSNYPKGLLPFHNYNNRLVTAFEEHLYDAALYAASNNKATLHFTVAEHYKSRFDKEFKHIQDYVEQKTKVTFNISYSFQKENTDTIAVTLENEPVVNTDGTLYFRPSGHGALLSNLNDYEADVVFINNIDNVVVSKYEAEVAKHKKILAGILLTVQEQAFSYLKVLDSGQPSEEKRIEIARFLRTKLNVIITSEFEKYSAKYQVEYLQNKLNRPIRVCGMVKNEGEPGGGPFWVKGENGSVSLQIVESAQVDLENKNQKKILKNATHFNPVDLVCGLKNYKGEKFDLTHFVDAKTAFITLKTIAGKEIKALESPGLWNGSMANWNTIFVEVPLITFNPVKTVTDLLKATHQV